MADIHRVAVTIGKTIVLDGEPHVVSISAEALVAEHEVPVEVLESITAWCFAKLRYSIPAVHEEEKQEDG